MPSSTCTAYAKCNKIPPNRKTSENQPFQRTKASKNQASQRRKKLGEPNFRNVENLQKPKLSNAANNVRPTRPRSLRNRGKIRSTSKTSKNKTLQPTSQNLHKQNFPTPQTTLVEETIHGPELRNVEKTSQNHTFERREAPANFQGHHRESSVSPSAIYQSSPKTQTVRAAECPYSATFTPLSA